MNTVLKLFMLMAVLAVPVQAMEVAGVEIPDTLDAEGTSLALNGAGIRRKFMMNIYVGGLYLKAPSSNAGAIIAADESMAMKLHVVSGLVTSEMMEEATMEGYEKAMGGDTGPLAEPIDAFINVFREEISKGDIFDLIYVPGKGVDIYKNGTYKNTVDGGLPFKQATFAIWIGDKPADKKLKAGMLGG